VNPALAPDPGQALKLFAEPTRLRILALLEREELSVGELSRALGMAQSRVSNHLRLLREAGLLLERRAGTSTFLHLARGSPETGASAGLSARLWHALRPELGDLAEHAADLRRLERVLAARDAEQVFERHADQWDKLAGDFASHLGRERAVAHLLPRELIVADLGCGTGYMADALVGRVRRVIAIDRSEAMLAAARERLRRAAKARPETEIELRRGSFEALPLADAECDAVLLGLVLHHLDDLEPALLEVRRVLKPGGTAVALELLPHKEAWMRAALGDRHLGLAPADVARAFARAGFEDVATDPVDDRYRPERPGEDGPGPAELELYVLRARRPRVRMSEDHARTIR
jgi:ArsR family transcriptional regulator